MGPELTWDLEGHTTASASATTRSWTSDFHSRGWAVFTIATNAGLPDRGIGFGAEREWLH
jgi:hypothetical protein